VNVSLREADAGGALVAVLDGAPRPLARAARGATLHR
jgi:hypothetical protein